MPPPDPRGESTGLRIVIDELYGMIPAQFTAARDARAAQARRAGDRDGASAIKGLRRPTLSAWLANLLVRTHRAEVELLLAVGASMRDAQDQLAAGDLRRLTQQRHQVVAALIGQARSAAAAAGLPVTAAAERELAGTLEAAVADSDAGEALRQGCLTAALRYAGFAPSGDTHRATLPEVGDDPARPGQHLAGRPEDATSAARNEEERRREIDAAKASVAESEAMARRARSLADRQARLLAEAEARHDQRKSEAARLRADLDAVDQEVQQLAEQLLQSRVETAAAIEAADAADADLSVSMERLDRLR